MPKDGALEPGVVRDHFAGVCNFGRDWISRNPQLHRAVIDAPGDAPHIGGRIGGVTCGPDLLEVERAAGFNVDDDGPVRHGITRGAAMDNSKGLGYESSASWNSPEGGC